MRGIVPVHVMVASLNFVHVTKLAALAFPLLRDYMVASVPSDPIPITIEEGHRDRQIAKPVISF